MSVQFGRYNFDGKPVDHEAPHHVRSNLSAYGPDAEGTFCEDNIGVLYRAFYTTKESHAEVQPHVSPLGTVITWDGRLDNREELISQLSGSLVSGESEVVIVAAAYERWGTDCFAKLIGDWALSICDRRNHSLILAKDFAGTRHLYYTSEKDQVTWSTVLDSLVEFAGHSFDLDEEYIAGLLSFFPAAHLTPYSGIHSVPPSSFVRWVKGRETVTKYWDFDPTKRIRHRTDREYEEHFRDVFRESVRRRLRADRPVLAELSGGMDSSSIVCMADDIIEHGTAETQTLDTVSYYDDSEPNWDERPYFTQVEEQRHRVGCHINVSLQAVSEFDHDTSRLGVTPGPAVDRASQAGKQFAACIASQGNRVLLSGTGGDEVTGGVPEPAPELADLLAQAHFRALARQLKVWALNKRKPWVHLLFDTTRRFIPLALVDVSEHLRPAPWLNTNFAKAHRAALRGYPRRLELFGPLPSFQASLSTLDMLRRQFGCSSMCAHPLYEKRYPFLDRNLLEFLYAVPREQLVRPGQRRSLMRRALVGLVPNGILDRKRKAFVSRRPITAISTQSEGVVRMGQNMRCASLGITDDKRFHEALLKAQDGQQVYAVTLLRTLSIEAWLRDLSTKGIWSGATEKYRTVGLVYAGHDLS